jgi:glycosyltransferase involved in cell wall biosynthesis
MIARNNEDSIGRCLDSVKHLVDEIIVVDTGSTDNTKEIVSRYTDKIYHFDCNGDDAAAWNHAFGLAAKDYILWLHTQDIFTEDASL